MNARFAENPVIQGIAEDISKEVTFIPIITIISIVISSIRLIWDCAKPKSLDHAKSLLEQSYENGYDRRIIISTQRAVLKAAREQGQIISRAQANEIAIKILDGMRQAPAEKLPDFQLI